MAFAILPFVSIRFPESGLINDLRGREAEKRLPSRSKKGPPAAGDDAADAPFLSA
jgi:hypothetical protein